MRVADVVGEGEGGCHPVRSERQHCPCSRPSPQSDDTQQRQDEADDTELLSRVERPHGQPVTRALGSDTKDHRLPPVLFRYVEPERSQSVGPCVGSVERAPHRHQVRCVLQRPCDDDRCCRENDPRSKQFGRRRMNLDEEHGEWQQQKNHPEVVAKGRSIQTRGRGADEECLDASHSRTTLVDTRRSGSGVENRLPR